MATILIPSPFLPGWPPGLLGGLEGVVLLNCERGIVLTVLSAQTP